MESRTDRVCVIKTSKGRTYKACIGKLGTVVQRYSGSTSVAVEMDGMINPSSSTGYFWFAPGDLGYLTAKEMEDNGVDRIKRLTPGDLEYLTEKEVAGKREKKTGGFDVKDVKKLVFGQYLGGSVETGFAIVQSDFEAKYKLGDIVVVPSSLKEYSLVRITRFPEIGEEVEWSNPIICKVDVSWFENHVEQQKHKAELQVKMKERAAQLQTIQLFESLAAFDANMAELVKEFKELG